MVWSTGRNNPALGIPNVLGSPAGIPDNVAAVPVGTIAVFEDEVLGSGEFIYLPGVASTALGDAVFYDLNPAARATTRLTNANATNSGRPVAFAATALPAGTFGWYQISGIAVVSAVGGVAAGGMFASATAGQVTNTADAGDQVLGARIVSAVGTPSAGKVYAVLNRPCMQGQIT